LDKEELTLGERVHLASKDLKNILRPSIYAALIGLGLMGLGLASVFNSTSVFEEYGYHEDHYNFPGGPICSTLDPLVNSENDPAKVAILEGGGAQSAGMQNGDVVVRINDMEIPDAKTAESWQEFFPSVQVGDEVEVEISRNDENISLLVETTTEDGITPVIGFIIPYSCDSYFFFDDEGKQLTLESIREIDGYISNLYNLLIAFGILFGYFLVWTLWKGRKLKKEVNDWEDAYLDQHYILTFETNVPKGKTNGEKILNMAQTVFPELRQKNGKPEKWKGETISHNNYTFDCYQPTNEEDVDTVFVAKHFGKEKITLETLQELVEIAKKKLPADTLKGKLKNLADTTDIFRLICVGEEYDSVFLKDKTLEKAMDELDFLYPIDLIHEKDGNYSVLWVEN